MALINQSQLIPSPPLHDPTITIEQTDGAIGSIFGFRECRSSLTHKITGRRDRQETSHNYSRYDPFIRVFPLYRSSFLLGQLHTREPVWPIRSIAQANQLGQDLFILNGQKPDPTWQLESLRSR